MITIHHDTDGWYTSGIKIDRNYLSNALYHYGATKPNHPMPAIPLAVKYDYLGCVNIDDVSDEDDPIIVYMFDSWTGQNV